MDSYFSLTNVAAATISLYALFGTMFFNRKSRSHQEDKTEASSLTLVAPPSSLPHSWKHHVFPSFHGADVRENFLSHIVKEFKRKAIDLFIDNDIERSKSIGPELVEAIRGSRIAIVLLSKNYASSTWCLNELVEIIKCREEVGQTVMSLFYQVDPTHVKKQTGDFGKVFRKTCKGKTKEEIQRWKHALTEVAQIAGFHSSNWTNEAEMIEDISADVSNKLNNSAPSSDFNGLVGMESHMKILGPLLQLDSDEVSKIGIWGPPGIGKTTIARYIFNRYSRDFDLSVFMDNIKVKCAIPACSDDYSVKLDLQKQFMSQLTNEMGIKIPHLGIAKDRLKDKRVLVILDDVDRPVQVEAVAKENSWFGPRSRIIITTQDQKVLKASGIIHTHKVNLPSYDEALQMFCVYAFGQKDPKDGFKELASKTIRLVGGLPLGIRVMGSYFQGMSEQEWTEALPNLRAHLDRDGEIANILKFCYDALNDDDRRLFLHIACFFNYENVDIVEGCLAQKKLDVRHGLRVLSDKSLIDISKGMGWGTIEMATLLVQLGRKIVREQSISEPGKRQFLTDAIDIGEVLSDDRADSSSVIGINDETYEDIKCTSERAFKRLYNLQFLRIKSDDVSQRSMNHISQKLRVILWPECKLTCFPSSFNPNFLVKLEMPSSNLEKMWDEIKLLSNLRWMDLNHSVCLKEIPDLSTATNLYYLDLSNCSSLVKLPFSIGNAINLENLDLRFCSNLVDIPSSIGNAVNLKRLDLFNCSSLVEIPSSITTIASLKSLELQGCSSLVELPLNIETITDPIVINLSYCSSLVKLPFSIGNAINLQKLDLSYCSSLVELPSSIGNAINLQELNLGGCMSLVELPSSIGKATNLQKLNLNCCSSLVELPFSIGNAINLQELYLHCCSSLVKLPSSIVNAINLQKLILNNCTSLMELPSSIWTAINLQELDLYNCLNMVELPSFMRNLGKLWKCTKLDVVRTNINSESLKELNLSECSSLKSYPESSTDIQELGPWIGRTSSLRRLTLQGMKKLVSLPQLPDSILELDAENCESLERLDCSFDNPDICLNFKNCFKLNQEARDLIIQTPTNNYAVFPAEEVPKCFTYRSSGNSLTVKLNQMPLGKSNKFKACIIYAGEDESDKIKLVSASVCCTITSGGNALTSYYKVGRVLTGHLLTFEVEVETGELTSTELFVEFEIQFRCPVFGKSETMEIKECGMLQLLEVPSLHPDNIIESFKDYEPSDTESETSLES